MKTVTVRLPDDLHRAVKVRCAERGDSFEGIAREAFWAYVDGGLEEGVARAAVPVSETVPPQAAAAPSSSPPSGEGVTRTRSGRSSSPGSDRVFRPDPKQK